MELRELDERLEALIVHLRRQGLQGAVPGGSPWLSYQIKDLVEAVTEAQERLREKRQL